MKEYILVPVLLATFLGLAAEIEDLGEQTSDRTLKFAQDATNALDCAYQARPLTECSPDITSHDFSEEIEETNRLLKEVRSQSSRISD